jgi:WD40 repeat protein
VFSPCGRYLFSSGTDNRVRKWDILTGKNMLVNYPDIKNSYKYGNQFCLSHDGSIMYHPNG